MPTPARVQAARVLAELERGRRTLAELLADPAVEALPSRERAFLHELVLGSLRHQGLLDHTLCPLLDRPLLELDPAVRHALRLGAYQLLRLRVPARAAVAESVELARLEAPRAAGLVNAVLRRLAREGPPSLPAPETDPLGWLTTEGSLPRWLAERWLDRLGPTLAVARAHAFLEPPPLTFRVNPRIPDAEARLEAAGLESRPLVVPGAREAIAGRPAPLAAVGLVYLQDQGSQLVAHVAAAVPRIGRPPSRVLDACAAPGGKSTLLADLLGPETLVAAAEGIRRRP